MPQEAGHDVRNWLLPARVRAVVLCLVLIAAGATALWFSAGRPGPMATSKNEELSSQTRHRPGAFYPSAAQWAAFAVEAVEQRTFRAEHATEGKIAIDEDRSTPIFSPYAGRVMKLLGRPGDHVERGQLLFTVEATDMVQAQNDFIAAATGLDKARSQLDLAVIVDKRQRDLYEAKAAPLKEVQQAHATLDGAQNDVRSSEVTFEAARNRLRILGKTDEEIADFQASGRINPETSIYAPIAGTIVQRKVGPGQYVSTSTSDPVFVIGDLSTVWLLAYVRETDTSKVRIGQQLDFGVLAYPSELFKAEITYVGSALDPSTRRLLVRATIQNAKGVLKPEMFASVSIITNEGDAFAAVAREAVQYDGDAAWVWVVHDDKSVAPRQIKTGIVRGKLIQVLDGLTPGEKVITKGLSLLDRTAVGT